MNWINSLRTLCDASGLSDAKFAAQLGVSKQYLSALLKCAKPLSQPVKLVIWSRLNRPLDLAVALSFLTEAEATEIVGIESARNSCMADEVGQATEPPDSVGALIAFRDQRGFNRSQLGLELGVTVAFLSYVLSRKKPIPWRMKIDLWKHQGYALSLNAVLVYFLEGIAQELVAIDHARSSRLGIPKAALPTGLADANTPSVISPSNAESNLSMTSSSHFGDPIEYPIPRVEAMTVPHQPRAEEGVSIFDVLADRVRAGLPIHVLGSLDDMGARMHVVTVNRLMADTGLSVTVIHTPTPL